MGLFKFLCKRVKCISKCSYNIDEIFDEKKLDHRLSMYELKQKDIIKIMNILNKRDMKPNFPRQPNSNFSIYV
tara:strand:+ start:422 stop:640 length:219 start_codon:yes stop_codon:yes gene_type:complete